jgi:ATP-binding cassette subfamily B protein
MTPSSVPEAPFTRHWGGSSQFIRYYVSQRRRECLALGSAVLLASSCAIVAQFQMKLLVDNMATGQHAANHVWIAFFIFSALIAMESGLWRISALLTCRFTIGIGVNMRLDLFNHLSGQSMRYFSENLAGALGQRITGTAGNFGALTNTVVWRMAPPVVDFVGAIVIFSLINWPMAMTMGVYVCVVTAVLIAFGEKGRPLHAAYFNNASTAAGNIVDVISNMWAVKVFSARQREWTRLKGEFETESLSQQRSWMYTEKTRMVYDVVLWIMAVAMLFWSLHLWVIDAISPGAVVVVSALTFRILHGARDFALALVDVGHQIGYIDDTLKVVGRGHTLTDCAQAENRIPRQGNVIFRDVSFGYNPTQLTLRDVNVQIHHGEKLGIVGPSGAGKTTIIQLIQRLYDVQSGEILIDGRPIGLYTQDALRSALSVVPQEIVLFHRSVIENIRFGRAGASDEEVRAAAQAACCEEFVRRLPDGFNTLVGERGVKLSGGQRQRVGIARALLKNAPLLLLDEATSALDTESEIQIQRNITHTLSGRTVVAVAHRLSTLASFDRVLVVANGQIVEEGSPAHLRQNGSIYQYLWRLQADGMTERLDSQEFSAFREEQSREVYCRGTERKWRLSDQTS